MEAMGPFQESNMAAQKCTREVITLQVGNYSNFVGAHFWNLQEALLNSGDRSTEINHDILYRHGQNTAGERTYKPRLICFDLKESFSDSLQQYGEVSDKFEASTWEGTVEKYDRGLNMPEKSTYFIESQGNQTDQSGSTHSHVIDAPANSPDNSCCFEEGLRSWLDYCHARFYRKSLHIIDGGNAERQYFGNFGSGEHLFQSRKFQDDFEDKLHFFAEECDRLQGFQIFSDIHDSFGGLTSGILQELSEEYSKKTTLCFPTMPTAFEDETRNAGDRRLLNILLGVSRYVNSSQTVPISLRNSFGLRSKPIQLPWIDYKQSSSYHTSAILATAIDTATMPWRQMTSETMNCLAEKSLPGDNRKISSLSVSLPIAVSSTFTPKELLRENKLFSSHFTSLTPDVTTPSNILSESVVIRGLPHHLLRKSDYPQTERQLCSLIPGHVNSGYVVEQPCLLTPLFPDIFKPPVTPVGCVVEDYGRGKGISVEKTSAMTRLQSCEEISHLLEGLIAGIKKANIKKKPGFLDQGIEAEDFEACLEDVTTMAQAYRNKYEL